MDLGFSLCGYVYTARGHPQCQAGTSEVTPSTLALREEQNPGVGEQNII